MPITRLNPLAVSSADQAPQQHNRNNARGHDRATRAVSAADQATEQHIAIAYLLGDRISCSILSGSGPTATSRIFSLRLHSNSLQYPQRIKPLSNAHVS